MSTTLRAGATVGGSLILGKQGDVGYISKFGDDHNLVNSNISDDGTTISVGGNLGVSGNINVSGNSTLSKVMGTFFGVNSSFTDLINNSTWYGIGLSNLVGGSGKKVQVAGYFGLHLKTSGNFLDIPITVDGALMYNTYEVLTSKGGQTLNGNMTFSGGTASTDYREIKFNSGTNSGSDYGYIRYYNHNTSYNTLNTTSENSSMVIGVQNDNAGSTSSDSIALESSGDIFFNPGTYGSTIGQGTMNTSYGKVYIGKGSSKAEVLHSWGGQIIQGTVDGIFTGLEIKNTSSGTSARSIFRIYNDLNTSAGLFRNNSTFSSDGGVNVLGLYNDGGGVYIRGTSGVTLGSNTTINGTLTIGTNKIMLGGSSNYIQGATTGAILNMSSYGTVLIQADSDGNSNTNNSEFVQIKAGTANEGLKVSSNVLTFNTKNLAFQTDAVMVWSCDVKCATWSRIFYLSGTNITGHNVLFNIKATRGSVVHNQTFLLNSSHSQRCKIVQVGNAGYSQIRIRGVVDDSGQTYVELYDTANSATNTTTQSFEISILHITNQNLTRYTAFTDGTTVPSGYVVKSDMTTIGDGLNADYLDGKEISIEPVSNTITVRDSSNKISVGGVLISSNYSDASKVPTNGLYSLGNIITRGNMGVGYTLNDTTAPTITLALGDSDTGFKWISDGVFDIYSNAVQVARINATSNGISIYKPLVVSSTLGVTGATTLSSTLGVTGATTLSSTLGVNGVTTLNEKLTVTRGTTIGGANMTNGWIQLGTGLALDDNEIQFGSEGYVRSLVGGILYLGITGKESTIDSNGDFKGYRMINSASGLGISDTSLTNGVGLSLYGGASTGKPTYGMMFGGTTTFGTYGNVSGDCAVYFTMSNTTNRGWIFMRGSTNVTSISGNGDIYARGIISSDAEITHTSEGVSVGFKTYMNGDLTVVNPMIRTGGSANKDLDVRGSEDILRATFKADGGFVSVGGIISPSYGVDTTMNVSAELNNEVNFGGTNTSGTIYFGYRAKGSKPIPSLFVFGSSTGTAEVKGSKFTSTVATGTAPMVVTSTTKVTNLNVDMVDDLHSSSFFRSDTTNACDVRLTSTNGRGLRFWDSDSFKVYMSASTDATWGGRMSGETTSDYNIYSRITGATNRGFVWQGTSGRVMGVDGEGELRVKGGVTIGDNKAKMQYNTTNECIDFVFM